MNKQCSDTGRLKDKSNIEKEFSFIVTKGLYLTSKSSNQVDLIESKQISVSVVPATMSQESYHNFEFCSLTTLQW